MYYQPGLINFNLGFFSPQTLIYETFNNFIL